MIYILIIVGLCMLIFVYNYLTHTRYWYVSGTGTPPF